ncbi:MAG: UDP-galactopyranose mutase [Ilumatobacteraceae bacterium]|nr:UDP-galactopyranose mutase [Actinomycetota bacterium]NCV96844.1 UDP-galactopyranose mutase [Acidimicrobiia bacterium]NBS35771.1 UDP-galactopyranose mutase [Actinomycetota bacterium]NCV09375.1 UDP-galactopyranose mutase [Actinomycetota bacterium]NCV47632.1 UDP-galactopyranose mutase [Actinomycetota bacterium]
MPLSVAVVGAGFSGAVVARELAEAGHSIEVFESRDHVAGNCHTRRHESGVMVHVYGPHIFHTQHERVWNYVRRFATFKPYRHRVRAMVGEKAFQMPMNLGLINSFFGTTFTPAEAEAFVATKADATITNPTSFEDQALRLVGRELYEAFFAGYTRKQWGVDPKELPASILARLPLRFTDDDSYFSHPYQGIPEHGYTAIVEAILDHPNISVSLSTRISRAELRSYDHVFWSGPIDAYFDHQYGRLGYRTLDFTPEVVDGDYQGCPVVNYCDAEVPYTRITEHKHFAPWESHDTSVIYREYSRLCGDDDVPYYPIRLVKEKAQLVDYVQLARDERGVTFLGRLGTYRYLDMDVTINEALTVADAAKQAFADGACPPAFLTDPLG